MRVHRAILAASLGAMWLLWTGCGQEAPSPKPAGTVVQKKIQKFDEASKPPGPEKARPGGPVQPPAAEKPAEAGKAPAETQPQAGGPGLEAQVAYQYVPGDRPDPFRPFHEEAKVAAQVAECEEVSASPLTEQEVSQFTLVAIVSRGADRVAMVQDRSGKGYVIRPGLHMGRKCGKVSEISSVEGVVVEEPYVDLLGQKKTRRVPLGFKKSQGGER